MAMIRLEPDERLALMALAALHREYGAENLFTSDAVGHVAGKALVFELGMLQARGLADLMRGDGGLGYRLTGPGYDALPGSEEKRALAEHREATEQDLREEQ